MAVKTECHRRWRERTVVGSRVIKYLVTALEKVSKIALFVRWSTGFMQCRQRKVQGHMSYRAGTMTDVQRMGENCGGRQGKKYWNCHLERWYAKRKVCVILHDRWIHDTNINDG